MRISLNWLKEFVDIPAEAAALGQAITQVGLAVDSRQEVDGDTVYELDVTTNRPDCLNHLGVAREVGAIFGNKLRLPEFVLREVPPAASDVFAIVIADADLCGRYCGRYIRGVKIGTSPAWMKKRLEVLGIRSINNVADATNYVMMELGHPLHAFDGDKIQGQKIIVRRAKAGERLTTLDGVDRSLDPFSLVIADSNRAVAIAGVMGGAETEISENTVNVFLESAWFQPASIRKTARALAMSTEASYRFERGADVEMARYACDRAAALIEDLAGGKVLHDVIDVYPGRSAPVHATLRRERIPAVLGSRVEDTSVERILSRLEFKTEKISDGWTVEVPSFRVDVCSEQDLLEEIARHHGFDQFPATLPAWRGCGAALPHDRQVRKLRDLLSSSGYSEIYTYPFSDEAPERLFYPDIEPVKLANPMSEEAAILRTSLVPGMLKTLQYNLNRGIRNLQVYELTKIYSKQGERPSLILGAYGNQRHASVHEAGRDFNFFDLKGDVDQILESFGVPARWSSDNTPRYYHPGRFARLGHVARLGELHPEYTEFFKIKSRVCVAEIEIGMLLSSSTARPVAPLPKYPSVRRDFSLLLDKGIPYSAVERTISGAGIAEIVRIEPFDLMMSGPFSAAKYSLSISVVYQSADRTLTDVEVEGFDKKLLDALRDRLGAQLRK
jgi:phenylalanyl-tRNA synthetase beta chain